MIFIRSERGPKHQNISNCFSHAHAPKTGVLIISRLLEWWYKIVCLVSKGNSAPSPILQKWYNLSRSNKLIIQFFKHFFVNTFNVHTKSWVYSKRKIKPNFPFQGPTTRIVLTDRGPSATVMTCMSLQAGPIRPTGRARPLRLACLAGLAGPGPPACPVSRASLAGLVRPAGPAWCSRSGQSGRFGRSGRSRPV